jgi:phosphoenolpyruvate synthase/pyruvate phosphate dikinase
MFLYVSNLSLGNDLFINLNILCKSMAPRYQKFHYYFSWGEKHSIISTESWLSGYITLKQVIANDNKNVFILVKDSFVNTYNTEEDISIAHKTGKKILHHNFLIKHLKKSNAVRQEYLSLYKQVKHKQLNTLKNKELLCLFKEYQELYDKTWAHFKVSQPEYLELAYNKLKSLVKQNCSDIEEKCITLTTPRQLDIIKKEELASYKLSLQNHISEADILKHAEQYPWLFWNTYNREIILNFLKKKFEDLKSIEKNKRGQHIEHVKKAIETHNQKYKKILKAFKKDQEEIEYLSSVFSALAVDRLKLKAWWGGAEYLFLPLFDEIAKRANTDAEELLMTYRVRDIESLLTNGKKISEKQKQERKKLYAVALEKNQLKFYEASEAEEYFNNNIKPAEETNTQEQEIRGVSANLGVATGKAYVVHVGDLQQLTKDMMNFKEGDVLVTTMTQPTMVSLARKAAAIVTNEGGLTSHASILAREFGIPCIVGTHTATEKIKSGDNIEVDANKGTVRILKQPNPPVFD